MASCRPRSSVEWLGRDADPEQSLLERRLTGMRWLLAFAAVILTLSAGVWYTTTIPPGEGSMECHGVPQGNRCVQFPASERVTKLVAAMPIVRQYSPLTNVRCYAKGSQAVCDGTLKHGRFGVSGARFRIQADGTVTPVCPRGGGRRHVSVFCVE
jgi:hypothetical protein